MSAENTKRKAEQLERAADRPTQKPMADISSCSATLRAVRKVHRDRLFHVIELIQRASQ